MLPHSSGTYVLAAPQRPEQASGVTPELIAKIVTVASQMFDHVVIDCPPYATEHVLAVLDLTDHLALVCTPDAASVKNTAISLEVLSELRFAGHIDLNRQSRGRAGWHLRLRHCRSTSSPSDVRDPPTPVDMPLATNHGRLLAVSHPSHDVSAAIRGYAQVLNPTTPSALSATGPSATDGNSASTSVRRGWRRHESGRTLQESRAGRIGVRSVA